MQGTSSAREWPEPIRMSDEIRALVDGRWAEYGIPRRDV